MSKTPSSRTGARRFAFRRYHHPEPREAERTDPIAVRELRFSVFSCCEVAQLNLKPFRILLPSSGNHNEIRTTTLLCKTCSHRLTCRSHLWQRRTPCWFELDSWDSCLCSSLPVAVTPRPTRTVSQGRAHRVRL